MMLIFALVGAVFLKPVTVCASSNVPDGFRQAAESDTLRLYVNPENGALVVLDKRNGFAFKSFADESSYYDYENSNESYQAAMQSFLSLVYTDLAKTEAALQETDTSTEDKTITVTEIPGGVAVETVFTKIDITVRVEMLLENNALVVRLPRGAVQETGSYGIMSLTLLPYFGASDRYVDGYMFYPDGSGAVTVFANADKRPQSLSQITLNIYGQERIYEIATRWESGREGVFLPVYGFKNGDNAFLAAITEGAAGSRIFVRPDGYVLNLNRACFDFVYRTIYQVPLSNITINGTNSAKKPAMDKAEKNMSDSDKEVRFFFLNGDKANYSGMAVAYRDYLEARGDLANKIRETDAMPTAVDYFMGFKEYGMLFDKVVPLTTYGQASTITRELLAKGLDNLQVKLIGWNKGGYSRQYTGFGAEAALGGEKGLRQLAETVKASGAELFLESEFLTSTQKYISAGRDAVYTPANIPAFLGIRGLYIVNPAAVLRLVKAALKPGYDAGLAINGIGYTVYGDAGKRSPISKTQTEALWSEALELTGQPRRLAVESGGLYALKYADRLYNVPHKGSGYFITDEYVPFFQMVVHGLIPYSGEYGNVSPDLRRTVLKWVEYGYMPGFELTYEKPSRIKDEDVKLFATYYADHVDSIAQTVKEMSQRLGGVWSSKMTAHEKLADDLFMVTYENGERVYVNSSEAEKTADGIKIPALDFVAVGKDGVIR